MDIKELKEKTVAELEVFLLEKRENVRKLRFDMVTKQIKNTKEISKEKKMVAKILTLINQNKKKNG